MKLRHLLSLPAGTVINGIQKTSVLENRDWVRLKKATSIVVRKGKSCLVLDENSWDSKIKDEVRFTYFPDEYIQEMINKERLKPTNHSKYIVPFFDRAAIGKNYIYVTMEMAFRDLADNFKPKDFVGVLLGETVIATNLFSEIPREGWPGGQIAEVNKLWCFEVFTRMLLSDRIIWLRLWNYIDSDMSPSSINIEEVQMQLSQPA